jgi:hypothetical protein
MLDIIYNADISPWAKPVGKIPTLARYQALMGLKPLGRHITLAESLLKDITCTCPTCSGTELYGTYGALGWLACPTCHGLGGAYRISLEELQALRQQVLDRYPEAGVPGWGPGYPIRCPVLAMDTGLIIDACPLRPTDPVQGELFPNVGAEEASFLPRGTCVGKESLAQSAPKSPATPRITWLGLWGLAKVVWRRLNAYS